MSNTVVQVENVGKKYIISHQTQSSFPTVRDRITEGAGYLKRKLFSAVSGKSFPEPTHEEFWALKDVSFEVKEGERIGIIGRNGAGKSTLLKLLSRITEPSTGEMTIRGRVASLLEVGTGFHPELTGRENIYLNGSILGMNKAEIKRKFDEIVAFSEVEKFLDLPVKHYSSGMYVRLAFAVAAHLEPEILIVDEVLAVGDLAFQKKCLGKMSQVSQEGRTILFVSHNMLAVKNLCQRAIWLEGGKFKEGGAAAKVVSDYLQSYTSQRKEQVWDDLETAPGNDWVRLRRLCARAEGDLISDLITMQTPLVIEVEFWNLKPDAHLQISLHLITEDNITAFNTDGNDSTLPIGLFRSVCHIPGNFLNQGVYRAKLFVVKNLTTVIYVYEDAVSFEVLNLKEQEYGYYEKEEGVIAPILKWTTECIEQKV